MTNNTNVVASFATHHNARQAVAELQRYGFTSEEIGVLAHGSDDWTDPADDLTGTKLEEGAGVGAAAGAVTGTGLGLAVAAGLIPPLGPAIAGGTLMALLASAGGGAAAGTFVGALVGMGIPEDEAAFSDAEFRAGRTVLTVRAGERAASARDILHRHGALLHGLAGTTV